MQEITNTCDSNPVTRTQWARIVTPSFALFVVLAAFLLLGCERKPVGSTITGTLSYNGKPVYPAIVLLRSAEGKGYSGNVDMNGEFRVHGLVKSQYAVAIEPIELPDMGAPSESKLPTSDKVSKEKDAEGNSLVRREDTRPAEYKNATVKIPKKYASFDLSGLSIDCTNGAPVEPIDLKLE